MLFLSRPNFRASLHRAAAVSILLFLAVPPLHGVTEASFVGNKACARCHADIYRRYAATPMATSSGRDLRPLSPGSFLHPASGIRYDIQASGAVRLSKGAAHDVRQLSYYFGSGAAGRSFGYIRDGFLFEAPVTWYAQTGSWDVSPGYQSDTVSRWSRPIDPSCLFCHASQPRWREGTVNAYADPAFEQDGVGCERCHGPGSLHIQGKAKMVNPATLSPPLRDSVCSQCHLTGQSRVTRAGRQIENYRPGDSLADFVAVFVPVNSNGFQVNSHVEKLAESTCKRVAGDRLWCGTCHDPHTAPAASQGAAWYRAKCLTCHQTSQCDRGFDCTTCHMPKSRAADANHGVFTDHSIPRIPGNVRNQSAASWHLRGFSPADRGERELGLAYAEIGVRTANRDQQAEAIRLLAAALATGKGDAEAQVRLADLEERAGNPKQAVALYQAALRSDPNAIVALVNLGRLYGSGGLLDEAIRLWQEALKRNPCQAEAGANLEIALRAKNDIEGAERVRRSQAFCSFE
jgi:predicted CXXCH cytochrome family protein